ncbi:MAG: COX15/CtaA family protein [Pirellulaceae bacterium]|nr:COX15/CtaA family protein [Pirellulaceae bacterium]
MDRQAQIESLWPHRLAVALALVTFPLIWVGGLVTTYDAGMAVPDWPGTYGYNLLLYPWQSWLAAPWDLFIEHGHRLLGATAGFIAIGLVLAAYRRESRGWVRLLAVGALVLVVAQGLLGGARVLLDERLVAMIHGCVGPLFFAYLAVLVVTTSRWWIAAPKLDSATGASFARAAWATVGLAYGQLMLGAILRHIPLSAPTTLFRAALLMHLALAAALALHVLSTPWRARRLPEVAAGSLSGLSLMLTMLIAAQLLLGLGTYVAKYSYPAWLGEYHFAAAHVVQEKGLWQSLVTTGHVANGSLILFLAVSLAARGSRLFSLRAWGAPATAALLAGSLAAVRRGIA